MHVLLRKYQGCKRFPKGMKLQRISFELSCFYVADYILKLCPQFDLLEELFGERPSIHPLYISDSDGIECDPWIELEVVEPVGDVEGNGSVDVTAPSTSPASPASPHHLHHQYTDSQPLQNATPVRPCSPRDSFSAFKRQMAKKPAKPIAKPTSALNQLHQVGKNK